MSRLSSFSPQRLRSWERRYSILKPHRSPGGHRLYSADDLRVLRTVRALLSSGRSIGEIDQVGRANLLADAGSQHRPHGCEEHSEAWIRRAVVAAQQIDAPGFRRVLDEAILSLSRERAIAAVVAPALERIGSLWSRGRCSIASEHLASAICASRLRALLESAPRGAPPGGVRVVLA